jgi:hypothetical protein
MSLYSKSKTPANDWDGDDLPLLGVGKRQIVTGLFDNMNCAALACIRNDGEMQYIFAPSFADKINQDDSVTKNALILGKGVDDTKYFQLVMTSSSALEMAVAFIKKDDAHPMFKLDKTIPVHHLDDTSLAGKKDIIAVYIPIAAPLQFQSNIVHSNISDNTVQHGFSQYGGEYQTWAHLNKLIHENYDDFTSIQASIISEKQEKFLISADFGDPNGVNIAHFAPYVNLSFVRNHEDFPGPIKLLKTHFGQTDQDAKPAAAPAAIAPTNQAQTTFALSRPEDEDKARKNETIRNKLRIFLVSSKNTIDVTNDSAPIETVQPELTPEFDEILQSKASESTKAEDLQSIVEAAITDDPSLNNLEKPKSAVSAAKSLICYFTASSRPKQSPH